MWCVCVCVCVCKYIYTHTHTYNGILLRHKKNEIVLFAATWMDLEGIILCEMSETNNVPYHICGIKKFNKLVNITKEKESHKYREQTSGYQ